MKDPNQLKEEIDALGGEFELLRELGQGATAVVYLLRDHALDRDVAMKVIRATFAADAEALARLQKAALANDNVFEELMNTVRVCSLGQITQALYDVGGQYRRNM